MGKILVDLQQLLVPSKAVVRGTVLSVLSDVLTVSTPAGPKTFRVANPGAYQAGDKVSAQGEALLGRVSDEDGLPFYSV